MSVAKGSGLRLTSRSPALLFRRHLGGPISSSPRAADLDGDGRPEIVVGGPRVYALRLDGTDLPGWPRRGSNAFASSAAIGDFDGDGRPELLIGSDDDCLHGFRSDGRPLRGFPLRTGNDVYSSPVLADLDGDGRLEVVVGSDDGQVYAWRADGSCAPGWPRSTGHFVAASPVVADLDGDGRPEVVVGSWDGFVYAWRGDGSLLPGWPVRTGHFVWSSAALADLDGDGRLEVIVAADLVYAWRADGRPLPGWPRATASYTVGSPLVVDLDGDGRPEVVVGSEALYAWRADGSLLPGFPVESPAYLWSSPAAADLDGDGRPEIVAGCWDGGLYAWRADGSVCPGFPLMTGGPIFSSPLVGDLDGDGCVEIVVGSWDGWLYCWRMEGEDSSSGGEGLGPSPPGTGGGEGGRARPALDSGIGSPHPNPVPLGEGAPARVSTASRTETTRSITPPRLDPSPPRPDRVTTLRCDISGPPARIALLRYRRDGETSEHPVPLVRSGDSYVGLFQPFRSGERVGYHLEVWDDGSLSARWPSEGQAELRVAAEPLSPRALVRRLRRSAGAAFRSCQLAGFILLLLLLLLSPEWEWAAPFGKPLGELALPTVFGLLDLAVLAWGLLLLGALGVWWVGGRRRPRLRPWGVLLPLLVLVALALLGAPMAPEPYVALLQARGLAAGLALYLLVRNSPRLARPAVLLFGGLLAIQAVAAVGQFALQRAVGLDGLGELAIRDVELSGAFALLDQGGRRWLRAYGLTGHPNILGGFLAAWMLVLVGRLVATTNGRLLCKVMWLLLGAGAAALALTFSRGAWLAFAVGLGCCWLAARRRRWPTGLRRSLLLASSLIGAVFALTLLPNRGLLVGRFDPSTSPLEGRSMAERAVEWRVAPALIAERPLLGVGAGNYTRAATAWHPELLAESAVQPAHNLVLLIGAELGLLGGLAWVVLCLQPLRTLLSRGPPEPVRVGLAAAVGALFAAGLFDHYLWTRFQALALLAVLLGLSTLHAERTLESST